MFFPLTVLDFFLPLHWMLNSKWDELSFTSYTPSKQEALNRCLLNELNENVGEYITAAKLGGGGVDFHNNIEVWHSREQT